MAAVLGAGLAAGAREAGVIVAFYAVYHVLIKGGLFLMLGTRGRPQWLMLLTGAMALGFAGLPLSGGALGKIAFKTVTGSGAVGLVFTAAAIASTVLMLHFLRLMRNAAGPGKPEQAPAAAGVAAAVAATLLPWGLFEAVTGLPAGYALTPGVLFDLAWPIVLGALVAAAFAAAGTQLPHAAPGDIGARLIAALERQAGRLANAVVRAETQAHQWPVSTLALAAALILFVALQTVFGPR